MEHTSPPQARRYRGAPATGLPPAELDLESATVRQLVIELAQVQCAMRSVTTVVEAATLTLREHDAVLELRRRDLRFTCRSR